MSERRTQSLNFDEAELNLLWSTLYRAGCKADDDACQLAVDGEDHVAKANEAFNLRSLRLRVAAALDILEKEAV